MGILRIDCGIGSRPSSAWGFDGAISSTETGPKIPQRYCQRVSTYIPKCTIVSSSKCGTLQVWNVWSCTGGVRLMHWVFPTLVSVF
jgi:hypothetical protein